MGNYIKQSKNLATAIKVEQELHNSEESQDLTKFQCSVCQKVFSGSSSRNRHYKYVHLKIKGEAVVVIAGNNPKFSSQ